MSVPISIVNRFEVHMWATVVQLRIGNGAPVSDAISDGDAVLEAWRERDKVAQGDAAAAFDDGAQH